MSAMVDSRNIETHFDVVPHDLDPDETDQTELETTRSTTMKSDDSGIGIVSHSIGGDSSPPPLNELDSPIGDKVHDHDSSGTLSSSASSDAGSDAEESHTWRESKASTDDTPWSPLRDDQRPGRNDPGLRRQKAVEIRVSECSERQPSLPETNASQPVKEPEPKRPRVKYYRGMNQICTDVKKALEILKTSYALPDVTIRKFQQSWSYWGLSDIFRSSDYSYSRNGKPIEASKTTPKLREVSMKIELRNMEIAEVLRKVLEMDDENKWDEFLMNATSPTTGDMDPLDNIHLVNGILVPGDDAIHADPDADHKPGEDVQSSEPTKKKRRNVFQRAASAIRKRFRRQGAAAA